MNRESDRLLNVEVNVLRQITQSRLSRSRSRAIVSGVLVFIAALLFIPAIQYAYSLADQSGFMDYLSVLIHDGGHLAGSWSDLLMSLIESAPIEGVIPIVAAVFALTLFTRIMLRTLSRTKITLA